jgi:hypothetical protein
LRQSIDTSVANTLTVSVGSGHHLNWEILQNNASFKITIGGVTQTITPDFSGVTQMADAGVPSSVVGRLQTALNTAFGVATINVAYLADSRKITITALSSITALDDPDIGLTLVGGASTSLAARSTASLVDGSVSGLGTNTVRVAVASGSGSAWKVLAARYSFNITIGADTRTINPDFKLMAGESMVAAATVLQNILNTPANFGAGSVTVQYDPFYRQFVITSTVAAGKINSLTHPTAAAGRTLLGAQFAYLNGATLSQPEKHENIHPGSQAGLHFSIAVDPYDSNSLYVGGDVQPTYYRPVGLSTNSVMATDWVGRLFRINPAAGAIPIAQDQIIGTGTVIPADYDTAGLRNPRDVETAPHADSRFITFLPDGTLIEGDDGGIYLLHNPRAVAGSARYWESLNGNLSVTEFSDVAYDTINDIITGGAQDVGNQMQTVSGSTVWSTVSKADGNSNIVGEDTASNRIYRYSIGNNLHSINRLEFDESNNLLGRTNLSITNMLKADDDFKDFTHMQAAVSPANGSRIAFAYHGVYESTDNGDTINPAPGFAGIGLEFNKVTALAYGYDAQQVLYVADGPFVYVRDNTGTVTVIAAQPLVGQEIIDIVVDPDDWRIAYALSENGISITLDGGANWSPSFISNAVQNGMMPRDAQLNSLELLRLGGNDLSITDHTNKVMAVRLSGAGTIKDMVEMINRKAVMEGLTVTASFDDGSDRILFRYGD